MLSLILNIQSYKESDQLVTILNELGLKVVCKAKSVKKISSRNLSKLEVGNVLDINLVEGKQFKIITESKVINNFSELKHSFNSIYLWLVLEFIQKIPELTLENPEIFELTIFTLESLENLCRNDKNIETSSLQTKKLVMMYLIEILKLLGIHLNFENYLDNHLDIEESETKFVMQEFGFGNRVGEFQINDEIYKVLKYFYNNDFSNGRKLNISNLESLNLALKTIILWTENLVQRKLNSYRFLRN